MKPPEEVLRELVRQWVLKADLDYQGADQLLQSADPLRDIVAFHCQQAAEKYLKAFLVRPKVFQLASRVREAVMAVLAPYFSLLSGQRLLQDLSKLATAPSL